MAFAPAGAPAWVEPDERQAAANDETRLLRERIAQLESDSAGATRRAFEEGRRQGEEQGKASSASALQQLAASITELTALRADARKRAERDVVELAILVARRVLHRELTVDKGALTALVRVILERMARSENWRVTIHPDFVAPIQSAIPAAQLSRIEFVADPGCSRGTVLFRSAGGIIDASIESQLEEISRGLTDRLS
jgi:flagellar assembly protein FliH